MIVAVNGKDLVINGLDATLQLPTTQDPRYTLVLSVPVENALLLDQAVPQSEMTVTVKYQNGTVIFSGAGTIRSHVVRSQGGKDTESMTIELAPI